MSPSWLMPSMLPMIWPAPGPWFDVWDDAGDSKMRAETNTAMNRDGLSLNDMLNIGTSLINRTSHFLSGAAHRYFGSRIKMQSRANLLLLVGNTTRLFPRRTILFGDKIRFCNLEKCIRLAACSTGLNEL
jgi:hypothetical protein